MSIPCLDAEDHARTVRTDHFLKNQGRHHIKKALCRASSFAISVDTRVFIECWRGSNIRINWFAIYLLQLLYIKDVDYILQKKKLSHKLYFTAR